MITKPLVPRLLPLVLSAGLAFPLLANEPVANPNTDKAALAENSGKCTNAFHLTPGPIDGRIATVTASLLEQWHYSHMTFDRSVSARFFDRYVEALDPQHLHFTQGDLAQFDHYRTNLGDLTLNGKASADTRPACDIFNRFLERFQQRVVYVDELLKTERFTFDTDERITINRHELPYPKDLDEARSLWKERLRFEYLQEKLGKDASKKQVETATAKQVKPATESNPVVDSAEPLKPLQGAIGSKAITYDAVKLAKSLNAPAQGIDTPAQARAREALHKFIAELDPVPLALRRPPGGETEKGAMVGATAPGSTEGRTPLAVPQGAKNGGEEPAVQSTAVTQSAPPPQKKTEAEEIFETLSRRYHRNLRAVTDWNSDDVLQVYLTTLAHIYDPHSDYFGHSQLESFSISMNLSLSGIGAELQLSEDGYCTIKKLLPGGPAEKSKKIKVNDRITAVAQGDQPPVDIVEMSLTKAVQLIRGPKGTEVRLTILPPGGDASPRVLSLIRDDIKLEEQQAKAKIIEMPDARGQALRLGVIDLGAFYAQFDLGGARRGELATKAGDAPAGVSTTADVSRLLKKMKAENVQGVILDLRRNGGGSLEEAINLTGLFIKEGPVVQVRNSQGTVEEDRDTDPSVLYEGPLVVLTSRLSASASEIVAGALQDYGRALIVGDASTHGKGTVQSVNPLQPHMQLKGQLASLATNDPGALKLTIKKFYRASGVSTQLKGVIPDIILPSVFSESKDIGESALENPLPCDSIASAKFERLNLVEPYLPELRKHSTQRVAEDKDFAYVREDIELFKKQQADKTISLNEKDRLKEKEEADARQKARDKERLARPEPQEKVYELTLRQADLPGLPPPVTRTNSALAKLSLQKAAGAGLTAAASAQASAKDDSLSGEAEEEKAPMVDADLQEAEHILMDYLGLLPKHDVATAGHVQ